MQKVCIIIFNMKLFFAPKAFIVKDGKVLVVRESARHDTNAHAGEYSFVGGRIDDGEPWRDGFAREVKEEIGTEVQILRPLFISESFNKVQGEDWHIVRCFFLCEMRSDEIVLSPEHDEYKWIDPANYKTEHCIENEYGAFEAFLKG